VPIGHETHQRICYDCVREKLGPLIPFVEMQRAADKANSSIEPFGLNNQDIQVVLIKEGQQEVLT
jgi:hypothetical protein